MVEDPLPFDSRYQLRRDEDYDNTSREGRKRLSTLRLVNRPFRQSASIRLFRSIRATINRSVREDRWPLARLLELCNSPYAPFVRRLHIGYNYFDRPGASEWEPGTRYHSYAEDASRLLPVCLARLSRLEILDVSGPTYPSLDVSVEGAMRLFTDAVVSTLRYVRLPSLAELNLGFPVTHEFGRFFFEHHTASRIRISEVMRQLRHLRVSISDFTVRDPQRNRTSPLSALREAYPNPDFISQMLRLIDLSTNLESLYILGSDVLDIDSLQIDSGVCLKYLKLMRVTISDETLIRILEQSRYSLRCVEFFWVELYSGRWENIFRMLATFPVLSRFYIDSRSYPLSGPAGRLLQQPQDGPDGMNIIDSVDHQALADLQRNIIANRIKARMAPYKKTDFRYIGQTALPTQNPGISSVGMGENIAP